MPLAASMLASVAMKGRILSRVIDDAVEDADSNPAPAPAASPGKRPCGAEIGGDDARQRRDRADRQIDAAGHDHEAHAERDQREHRVVAQEGQDIERAEEIVVAPGAEEDEEDEGDEHPLRAEEAERGVHHAMTLALQPDRQDDEPGLDHERGSVRHAVGKQACSGRAG